jgi:hypothetical protein
VVLHSLLDDRDQVGQELVHVTRVCVGHGDVHAQLDVIFQSPPLEHLILFFFLG